MTTFLDVAATTILAVVAVNSLIDSYRIRRLENLAKGDEKEMNHELSSDDADHIDANRWRKLLELLTGGSASDEVATFWGVRTPIAPPAKYPSHREEFTAAIDAAIAGVKIEP